jgi:hypothetical protein
LKTEITVAIVGVISSLSVAIYSSIMSIRNEKKLELLKSELEESKDERNARRDYEYEAKKRLYQEYEPLLFQLSELSEVALSRIEGIAKNVKDGLLTEQWSKIDNNYFKETIYKIFAPLAVIKLIQNKLTIVDFNIENEVSLQYGLMKILYFSYQEDGKISRYIGDKKYFEDWKINHTKSVNEVNGRQGISLGEVDKIVDLFISTEGNQKRIIDYGEFEDLLESNSQKVKSRLKTAEKMFLNFHPEKKKVLWTLLLSHAAILKILTKSKTKNWITEKELIKFIDDFYDKNKEDFYFVDDKEKNEPFFEGAKKYLKKSIDKKIKAAPNNAYNGNTP